MPIPIMPIPIGYISISNNPFSTQEHREDNELENEEDNNYHEEECDILRSIDDDLHEMIERNYNERVTINNNYVLLLEKFMLIDNITNKLENIRNLVLMEMNMLSALNNVTAILSNYNQEAVIVCLTRNQFDNLGQSYQYCNDNINQTDNDTQRCSICQEKYNNYDLIKNLPCGHNYHMNCIFTWLCQRSVYCPICRKDCRE